MTFDDSLFLIQPYITHNYIRHRIVKLIFFSTSLNNLKYLLQSINDCDMLLKDNEINYFSVTLDDLEITLKNENGEKQWWLGVSNDTC